MHQPILHLFSLSSFIFSFLSSPMDTISVCKLKNHNIAILSQSIKAHYYLVKLTQLFISVSLFSFIFSPSSLFVFLHYFKFYFSTFPFQLLTHNIDKNSMFLLCNGLLVFVGITTKSFSTTSSYADNDKPSNLEESSSRYVEDDGSHSQSYVLDVEANEVLLEREVMKETSNVEQEIEIKTCCEEEVDENIEKVIFIDEDEGKESSHLGLEEEVVEQEEEEESEVFDAADEEESKGSETDCFLNEEGIEEEENVKEESCMISIEELNKKFEDFIRKMREDLRIEARRQLIMV